MKVDKGHMAAPFHHSQRCDGGVDTTGEQGNHRAAGADGQAAGAAHLLEIDQGLIGQHLDKDGRLGLLQAHRGPRQLLHHCAQLLIQLGRG